MMATAHRFFATRADFELILSWITDAGAEAYSGNLSDHDFKHSSRVVLCFPQLGNIEFYSDEINLDDYPESTPRWRVAVLAKVRQQESPNTPQIDTDRSPVAGLDLPYQRYDRFWVSGSIWFPTRNLTKVFPELGRVCSRFQRRLRKHELVYDNTGKELFSPYDYNLLMSGIVQRVYALPEAGKLLERGEIMIDHMSTPRCYEDFKKSLRLRGIEV